MIYLRLTNIKELTPNGTIVYTDRKDGPVFVTAYNEQY
jgi:hypothetical protein